MSVRRCRLAALTVVAAVAAAPVLAQTGAAAGGSTETYRMPASGVLQIDGHGFGHGHGMSQWGAYGAASTAGLSAGKILSFYYPGTTRTAESTTRRIRVSLSAADAAERGLVEVLPASGLEVHGHDGTHRLPTESHGQAITAWELEEAAGTLRLRAQRGGTWHTTDGKVGPIASFRDTASEVPVVVGSGATTTYRGRIYAEVRDGTVEAVDRVQVERYLLSVVPVEMPTYWPGAALQAQAVAARTYAAHGIDHPKADWFDVDGDTRDQAYGGVGAETAASTAAVRATAGSVLTDPSGAPILAQFGSADGGWTVSGGVSYLPSRKDRYDGAVANTAHSWTASLPASSIQSIYRQLGTLKAVIVTARDGHGQWGGRIETLTLKGTKTSVDVSGATFAGALGLRSAWWRPTS